MRRTLPSVISVLLGAGVLGAIIGVSSVTTTPSGIAALANHASDIAVSAGLKRLREPQLNDRWGGCNDARASGTAPIYHGEPGYREDMDGDGDGIACER